MNLQVKINLQFRLEQQTTRCQIHTKKERNEKKRETLQMFHRVTNINYFFFSLSNYTINDFSLDRK